MVYGRKQIMLNSSELQLHEKARIDNVLKDHTLREQFLPARPYFTKTVAGCSTAGQGLPEIARCVMRHI